MLIYFIKAYYANKARNPECQYATAGTVMHGALFGRVWVRPFLDIIIVF
jgi:hypothetical protein